MKKEEFIKLLEDYNQFQKNCEKYSEMGIELYESKYPTWTYTEKFFDFIINQEYNNFGVDWINWFVYENDMGRNKMGAWDEKILICQSVEELYEYIEKHRK